ncbi:MAG TPA: bifunctional salicylyl-CoA 5-hydroxylase/oxidoreductase [Mycobacteriales bacterium]|nr:bifunctional salicylyl-CoA 5-hydroxylase/oxidoreductase [Mycobacteriales bacterium]
MRIAVVGGGPGGLYLAALVKQLDASHDVVVWERNAPDDTFGFGVVFSDETLGGIEHADPTVHAQMAAEFARWDDIDIHHRGHVTTSGGHSFAAMSRRRLLQILQERCLGLGVAVHHQVLAPDVDALAADYDLVVAADGANSATRRRFADTFRPSLEARDCRYMWLGTDLVFDAFTFAFLETPYGVMQAHGYPYDATGSTFIAEMSSAVWRRAGFEELAAGEFAPGDSDHASIARVRELFADVLGDAAVHANNSRWITFTTVRNETWRHRNVVLIGDAAHTAHFSIGSGTKLAMEDALALAACLHEHADLDAALTAYEVERRPVVLSTQRSAQASLEWFEHVDRYIDQEPLQFAFNVLTRSRRITHENLRLRDPEFVASVDAWFARTQVPPDLAAATEARPAMFQPFRLRELELSNRIVVSAMDMYSAVDGTPNDFHLVHLGGKALGGAGLVMTEMVCVSDTGRITPGCTGMYDEAHEAGWARIVDFIHRQSAAKVGIQLGHSGRKGSTRLMWEGIDDPLPTGNWEVCGPSPIPYSGLNQTPRELQPDEMTTIRDQFVRAAEMAERAGFDLLELHCAHGYLLSSFLSPLTNSRTDAYGGSLENRLRYPLEVLAAVRAVWPESKPISVRVSATDWHEGGVTPDDGVQIAAAFAASGADVIDVSTGQVVKEERPAYGRSYQTPFADRIRHEVGIATIAVGAISSYDDVNSILLAGRADLCALGRTHLYDPQWTLHAAAEQGYVGPGAQWPMPFAAGSRRPQGGRNDDPKPRLQLVREGEGGTRHQRWRPTRP